MGSLLTAVLFLSLSASAEVVLREEKVHSRSAWVLDNGLIRVAALAGGGHLAEIRLVSGDPRKSVNPMRVPHYPTIDPHTYDPARHDATYGDQSHRWLSAGYMGHLLCFPFYGPPSSDDEIRAKLGNHGEAPIAEWKKIRDERRGNALTLWYAADLPKTHYRVERAVTLGDGQRHVHVEEWVENLADYDRPFQWMQHATFGPPFVEPGKTVLDASATKGLVPGAGSLRSGEVHWPNGATADGQPADLRVFQTAPNTGTYYALLMDPSRKQQFFTMHHREYRVLIGYIYPTEGNPWLADWQENKRSTFKPWNGQVVARGMEFGNSPVAEGLRKAVDRGSLFGVPAYGWIGARAKRRTEFTVFLREIPEGFAGVRDVRMDNGTPVIVER
jgi:hypothetical protein